MEVHLLHTSVTRAILISNWMQSVYIRYKSLKSLPVQSVLRVPVQKLRALNGPETKRPFMFRSFFAAFKGVLLQLQLANAAPEFVLRKLSAFPQQKQKINKFMVARAMCVMYYGRSCA